MIDDLTTEAPPHGRIETASPSMVPKQCPHTVQIASSPPPRTVSGLSQLYRQFRQAIHEVFSPLPQYEDLRPIIRIELHPTTGIKPVRAEALIDTGCEDDVISYTFARHLGYEILPGKRHSIGRTIDGNPVFVIGEIETQWCIRRADSDYYDGRFFVTEFESDFDVLIGSNTIKRLDMLKMDRRFVAPVRPVRSALPKVNQATVAQRERERNDFRAREFKEMMEHDAQKDNNRQTNQMGQKNSLP